jgi:copper/silver efflux system protein
VIDRIITFSVQNKALVFALVGVACLWGLWSMLHLPVDAMPDLGETQIIIIAKWDRSPDVLEDQVTFPIISSMTSAPRIKAVRGISDFGFSYIYIVFEDGTDIDWARSKTREYLSSVASRLPAGVTTEIGPDATSLGWVYQYVLEDRSGQHTLGELRSYQDWYLKYFLASVPGVAEVASLGGFTQQFQVNVDPHRLRSYGIPLSRVTDAVRQANHETGARLLDFGGAEYMIRGHGYLQSIRDVNETVLGAVDGTPIFIKDVANVTIGPDMRRGLADLNGAGEVVSGIVLARQGSNTIDVIAGVKNRLRDIEASLPPGVKILPVYDRSVLIHRAISNARVTLTEVILAVILIICIFLWNFPSAMVPVLTIPATLLVAFIPLHYAGVSINIMSLAGIALACGELVDAAIIVVEQVHKKLESYAQSGEPYQPSEVILSAIREVAGPTFFTLLVLAVAFLPVLALEGQEGKLFRPLVYAKTFALLAAAGLAITLTPALRVVLTSRRSSLLKALGRFRHEFVRWSAFRRRKEQNHPIMGPLIRAYMPMVRWTLRWKTLVIVAAVGIVLLTVPVFWKIGSEFIPAIDEGALLYMPSTMPGISIAESQRLLQVTDGILANFPEVAHVLGKAGRADTATDPAPLSMLETIIVLKPQSEWRHIDVWYSPYAPGWLLPLLRHITPDHISEQELVAEMNAALQIPGLSNSWTMPIRGRIDMLSTGMRTPVGLKIQGTTPAQIQEIGEQCERVLRSLPGTRNAFAERASEGYFLDIDWDRKALARYGLSIEDAQNALATAVGGENIGTVIKGRERYPINVRYARDFRSDLPSLGNVLISVTGDKQIPISQLATLRTLTGPAMLRNENGLLTEYVFVDVENVSPADYVERAKRELQSRILLPEGSSIVWSGQYESAQRVRDRLYVMVPVTMAIILFLIYCNTRSMVKTLIVILAVPFSAVGAVWMVYALGYDMSIAVWVGVIALLGIDAETGVFMLLYLDLAYARATRDCTPFTLERLCDSVVEGAAMRLRPKFMTFAAMVFGLIPIMWSTGTGSEIMKRIAAPMLGGIITSFLLELFVYPAIYTIWKARSLTVEASHEDLLLAGEFEVT